MPAPKGHPLWGNPLNPKKYTPDGLWDKFCEYLQYCKENPVIKEDFISGGQRAGEIIELKSDQPLCIEEFCNFADISTITFFNYTKTEGYETFFNVCQRIRQVIDSQHFRGGMAGIFNANIVTRKLGLAEKNESNIVHNITVTKDEAKEIKSAFDSEY